MRGEAVLPWLMAALASAPLWASWLWLIWQGSVRPRLIPPGEIEAAARALQARWGAEAAERAFLEEEAAWSASQPFAQGRWRRIRHWLLQQEAA